MTLTTEARLVLNLNEPTACSSGHHTRCVVPVARRLGPLPTTTLLAHRITRGCNRVRLIGAPAHARAHARAASTHCAPLPPTLLCHPPTPAPYLSTLLHVHAFDGAPSLNLFEYVRVAGGDGFVNGQWMSKGLYLKTRLADTSLPADAKLRLKKRLRRLGRLWKKQGARFESKQLANLGCTYCASLATLNKLPPFIAEETHTASALHTALAHPNHPLARFGLRATDARTSCAHFKVQHWVLYQMGLF